MKDTLCECNHWFEEHDAEGACECGCLTFTASEEFNTPEYIADRGGEHQCDCQCALCRWYPVPAGMKRRDGVEFGCGAQDCERCYEPR